MAGFERTSASVDVSDLRDLMVCPGCHGELRWLSGECACGGCGARFPIEDGIPVLLLAGPLADLKRRQVDFYAGFDAAEEEYEITRPHGTPALYRWLMTDRFRGSIAGVGPVLAGRTALSVCGGAGMDADLLARTGARVICSDLSAAAVRRARCRAERFGLPIVPIVADVERLPFRDRSVDLVYVQDGLHHIEDPYLALAEMARVARRAVSLTEPADGAVPRLAVRLGLGLEHEPAGNRVARLDRGRAAEVLRSHGLAVTRARRYLIYYRHHPGRVMEALSRPAVMALVRTALSALNATLGRHGNRLTVQAVRAATPPDRGPTPTP